MGLLLFSMFVTMTTKICYCKEIGRARPEVVYMLVEDLTVDQIASHKCMTHGPIGGEERFC